ncbi:MAG: alkaline phosphatase family protein [Thaumarchaeota archaeon]|nr:alkaline phosphatase family protein [Nitrososphaerota archaeon]
MMSVKYKIIINLVGLEHKHLGSDLAPNISALAEKGESAKMEPVFPAVTCTVQASILSGKYPNEHGIIANGLYDRGSHSVSFWEQASSLVQRERVWDTMKRKTPSRAPSDIKTAVLFWQNTMFANSDVIVTPRPLHMGDGSMIQWCYSKPLGWYEETAKSLGEFSLATYWGPMASSKSSEWIGKAAEYTMENLRPNLMFVYIPHVDYSAQRFGKNSSQVRDDIKKADSIVGNIVDKASKLEIGDETEFLVMSEYSFDDVSGAVPINVKLRDAGLLQTRTIAEKEYVDFEYSKAFAMVDHQVAHIYIKGDCVDKTHQILRDTPGIDKVLSKNDQKKLRINNERSGELIAISDKNKWFSYYWWHDPQKAPPFAETVDIHRKPGYDPVELFFDREKKCIPFDTNLIKGSHGRPPDLETGDGLSAYVSNRKSGLTKNSHIMKCVDILGHLMNDW